MTESLRASARPASALRCTGQRSDLATARSTIAQPAAALRAKQGCWVWIRANYWAGVDGLSVPICVTVMNHWALIPGQREVLRIPVSGDSNHPVTVCTPRSRQLATLGL